MSTVRHAPICVAAVLACVAMSPSAEGEPMDSWYTPPAQSPVGLVSSLRLHIDFEPVQADKLASVEARVGRMQTLAYRNSPK